MGVLRANSNHHVSKSTWMVDPEMVGCGFHELMPLVHSTGFKCCSLAFFPNFSRFLSSFYHRGPRAIFVVMTLLPNVNVVVN